MSVWSVILLVLSLMFSAFFSGVEIAFISASKLKFELDKKQKQIPARILAPVFHKQQRFIAALLIGNNIAIVIYSMMMAAWLEPLISRLSESNIFILTMQTIISTLIILFFAEFLPKAVFRINPNRALNIFALPIAFFYYLLFIPVEIVIRISESFLNLFMDIEFTGQKSVFGRTDLDHYLEEVTFENEQQGEELANEIRIMKNALDFSSIKARECMVPRNEIVAVDVNMKMEELKRKFIRTGLSKIIIYRDTIDNIIGYTHSYELFKNPESVKNMILPVNVIPESMPANEILEIFISTKRSMVVVLDEFGGTAGIITIEDILEELFGEIQDEHDVEALVEKELKNGEYEFSARLEVDYINEKYSINLPESDDYETLAGLIFHYHQSIPEAGEKIHIASFEFIIRRVNRQKIDLVHLIVNPE